MDDKPNRRDFLRGCVASALLMSDAAKTVAEIAALPVPEPKSRVVVARDTILRTSSGEVDLVRVGKMLDRAMQAFFNVKKPADAWKQVVKPSEVIGLKINGLGGPRLTTNGVLVEAVIERLTQAGVALQNIVVFDRSDRDLRNGGFTPPQWKGVRVMSNRTAGHEEELARYGSVTTQLSKILTRTCDGVINLPILKDHELAGVTMAMKSMYGVINNPGACHGSGCNPGIADLNMLPAIRQKIRLTISDATTAVFEGGPGYNPQWAWQYNGIIVGRDPVALDTIACQIIEQKRKEAGLRTLKEAGREPKYIATAADEQHRLGTNDLKRIEYVEL